MLVALVAGVIKLSSEQESFAATATVQLSTSTSTTGGTVTQQQVVPSLSLVTSTAAVAEVANKLSGQDAATLAKTITTSFDSTTNIVEVTSTSTDQASVVPVANAFANAYVAQLQGQVDDKITTLKASQVKVQQQIQQTTDQLKAKPGDTALTDLLSTETTLNSSLTAQILLSSLDPPPGKILEEASSAAPVDESVIKVLGIALTLALLGSVGAALAWSQFDTRVRHVHDVENATGLRVMARLPYTRGYRKGATVLPVRTDPRAPFAESIRELRTGTQVLLSATEQTPVVVVTSPAPGDGKTLVTANLAASFALGGKRTLLVSADLRRPRIDAFFNADPNTAGLSELLETEDLTAEKIRSVVFATEVPGLALMQAGSSRTADPADGLASTRMQVVLAQLREDFDIVIIDTPPVLAVADALILSEAADGTVLVVRAGSTRTAMLEDAIKRLESASAQVLGIALNRSKQATSTSYSYAYLSPSELTAQPEFTPRPPTASVHREATQLGNPAAQALRPTGARETGRPLRHSSEARSDPLGERAVAEFLGGAPAAGQAAAGDDVRAMGEPVRYAGARSQSSPLVNGAAKASDGGPNGAISPALASDRQATNGHSTAGRLVTPDEATADEVIPEAAAPDEVTPDALTAEATAPDEVASDEPAGPSHARGPVAGGPSGRRKIPMGRRYTP